MNRKTLVLIMAVILAVSIPVFADEPANTTEGIKPDSPLYILDRLIERIQISIITDAVKESEALAGMAQERLAESKAMAEKNDVEKATKALSEYKELMDKAIDLIDAAAKDGKAVTKAIDKIIKYGIEDEEILEKLMDKVPEECKDELEKAIEALPEKEAVKPESNTEEEEKAEKVSAVSALFTGKLQGKTLLEKIEKAGLNDRQISAIVSMSEQSDKTLSEILDLFLTNEKGIGKTIIELDLAPKDAIKNINKTFKEVKKETKAGLVKSDELNKNTEESISINEDKNKEDNDDEDKNDDNKDKKDSAKLEKNIEKTAEKLEKKIEQTEKKYDKKLDKADHGDAGSK